MDHTVLPANNTMPAFPSSAFTRCHHHNNWGSRHPIAAYYSYKECGPMPNLMVALPNTGGALCSTPQSLADAHY